MVSSLYVVIILNGGKFCEKEIQSLLKPQQVASAMTSRVEMVVRVVKRRFIGSSYESEEIESSFEISKKRVLNCAPVAMECKSLLCKMVDRKLADRLSLTGSERCLKNVSSTAHTNCVCDVTIVIIIIIITKFIF